MYCEQAVEFALSRVRQQLVKQYDHRERRPNNTYHATMRDSLTTSPLIIIIFYVCWLSFKRVVLHIVGY
jgi:hypothetical protein